MRATVEAGRAERATPMGNRPSHLVPGSTARARHKTMTRLGASTAPRKPRTPAGWRGPQPRDHQRGIGVAAVPKGGLHSVEERRPEPASHDPARSGLDANTRNVANALVRLLVAWMSKALVEACSDSAHSRCVEGISDRRPGT